jgi:hypothetical protein
MNYFLFCICTKVPQTKMDEFDRTRKKRKQQRGISKCHARDNRQSNRQNEVEESWD